MSWQGEYARRFNTRVAIERPPAPMTAAEREVWLATLPPQVADCHRVMRRMGEQIEAMFAGVRADA